MIVPRRRVVLWLVLSLGAGACASAPGGLGVLVQSPDAPIPLRAGYWPQPEFQDARFTGGGLDDASFGDIMGRGLVGLARSSFRGSAQFESRDEALRSPLVDVVVAPTVDRFTMEPDPEGAGPKQIATVRMQWRVSDKAGRVLWSNLVVTQRREACLVQWCRKELAERAVREHFEAAGAEMRSFPWWQRPRRRGTPSRRHRPRSGPPTRITPMRRACRWPRRECSPAIGWAPEDVHPRDRGGCARGRASGGGDGAVVTEGRGV